MTPTRDVAPKGSRYRVMFDALLTKLAEDPQLPHDKLTPFLPLVGDRYTGELMVIGRAVNGWLDEWSPGELRDPGRRDGTIQISADYSMDWVVQKAGDKKYNTNRSAFWRVVKRVALDLGAVASSDVAWSSHIAWSNLYKIAPTAGGNPSAELRCLQFSQCVSLLALEVEQLRPRHVLCLTGIDWFEPFAVPLGLNRLAPCRPGFRFVDGMYLAGLQKWVVAQHPQGKPENEVVAEVVTAFGRQEI